MITESLLIRPRGHLLKNLMLFVRLLRSIGVQASPDQVVDLVEALPLLDLRRKDELRDAARAMLVTSRDQAALFDDAFDLFWRAWSTEEEPAEETEPLAQAPRQQEQPGPDDEAVERRDRPEEEAPEAEPAEEAEPAALMTYSARELLRHKDFAELTEEELRAVGALIRSIRWQPELHPSRRKRDANHGSHLDLRRVLREGLRYGGETIELAWQQPRLKRRPMVAICDVSGSMERYTRVLLQFLYAMTHGLKQVEAFAFGTRLTHLTRQLRHSDVDQALRQAGGQINDSGAGTRIGESLKTFNFVWARRVLGHGPTVMIISDGWDRGDLALLAREMRRLRLSCRRLIWLNPLLGQRDYQPLALGIQTVLPFVDDFLPIHNLASLERLAAILEQAR